MLLTKQLASKMWVIVRHFAIGHRFLRHEKMANFMSSGLVRCAIEKNHLQQLVGIKWLRKTFIILRLLWLFVPNVFNNCAAEDDPSKSRVCVVGLTSSGIMILEKSVSLFKPSSKKPSSSSRGNVKLCSKSAVILIMAVISKLTIISDPRAKEMTFGQRLGALNAIVWRKL